MQFPSCSPLAFSLQLNEAGMNLGSASKRQYPCSGEEVVNVRKTITNRQGTGPGTQDPCHLCVHVKNGQAELPKTCIRDYECWHCAFDQWLELLEEGQKTHESLIIPRVILAQAA